jgi:transcriptional regulator with XRE-family HTH domain
MSRKNEDFRKNFASRLREALGGRTQTAVSKQLECSQAMLSAYLSGQIPASLDLLAKLAAEYNIDVNWLLTGQPSPMAAKEAQKYKDLVEAFRIFAYEYSCWIGHLRWDLLDEREALVAQIEATGDKTLVSKLQDTKRRLSELRTAYDERMARYTEVMTALGYPGTP